MRDAKGKISKETVKPGDIIYGIYVDDTECKICINKYKVEDIGYYEVKVVSNWLPIDDSLFAERTEVEKYAYELGEHHGYLIVENDWSEEDT